jgi:hypothetical protein
MQTNYNNLLQSVSQEDRAVTALFLDKYWLPFSTYQNQWEDKVNMILPRIKTFEDLEINPEYHKTIAVSGILITEESLASFYQIMRITGDSHFLILEIDKNLSPSELLRLKIPIDTEITAIKGQSGFSVELTSISTPNYIVMGENGDWALFSTYAGYYFPMNLYIYRSHLETTFHNLFREYESSRDELVEHIPFKYLEYL